MIVVMLIAIGIITVLLGIVAAWKLRKEKAHAPDYRAFFIMGITFMPIGLVFTLIHGFAFNGLFAIGFIFFIMGLANRGKWKNTRPPRPWEKKAVYLGIVLAAALVLLLFFLA